MCLQLSDIPDWCSVEVDGCSQPQEGTSYPPSQEAQARMYAASPIAHIDAVNTPVMLMLGLKDRRVPPPDGLAYARALRYVSFSLQETYFGREFDVSQGNDVSECLQFRY